MFDNIRQWEGTAETLAEELAHQIQQLKLVVEVPTVRTIRLWRSKRILSQPKKQKFGFRQILEGLIAALLLKQGWTLVAISQVLPSFSDLALEQKIIAETAGISPLLSENSFLPLTVAHRQPMELVENAVILLAQGVLRLYTQLLTGLGIVKQDDKSIPPELYKAMCQLGRLYIESGQTDQVASVHQVLDLARYPFNHEKWNLKFFQDGNFIFKDSILIDHYLRVPTNECADIANHLDSGFGEDNLIQKRIYNQLREATERLGNRQKNLAYTAIRELLGRFSLIQEHQLFAYLVEHSLTTLQRIILDNFFDSVPDIWLIHGKAHRCGYCGTLMRPQSDRQRFPQGQCPISQCVGNLAPVVGEKLDPNQDRLLIAKPQILTFWTTPALDELMIYDAAKKEQLAAELYPESDLCDVAIAERFIGIDAKSYRNPIVLAFKLNKNIGGLINYRQKIIAISDYHIKNNPYYLQILQEHLDDKYPQNTLELLSVSQIIQRLKDKYYES